MIMDELDTYGSQWRIKKKKNANAKISKNDIRCWVKLRCSDLKGVLQNSRSNTYYLENTYEGVCCLEMSQAVGIRL